MKIENTLTNSLIESISKSALMNNPFDHKFVTDVFPHSFYEEFMQNMPDKNLYVPIVETGSVSKDYSPERYIFNLLDKTKIAKLSMKQNIFFKKLLETMLSNELFSSVTSQFAKTIDNRLQNLSSDEVNLFGTSDYKFSMRVALVKDFTKYTLGAHTDNISKFVTYLFYIPKDNSLSDFGTSLYKPINDLENSEHFNDEKTSTSFTKIKTCPYLPNTVLIFPRTNKSFHGVEEININKEERNLFLLNYYIIKK